MVYCQNREYSNKTDSCQKARVITSVFLCRLTSLFQKLSMGCGASLLPARQSSGSASQTTLNRMGCLTVSCSPCCAGCTSWTEHRKGKRGSDRTLNLSLAGLCQKYHCPWSERHCKLRMNFSLTRKNLAFYYPYCPTTPLWPLSIFSELLGSFRMDWIIILFFPENSNIHNDSKT